MALPTTTVAVTAMDAVTALLEAQNPSGWSVYRAYPGATADSAMLFLTDVEWTSTELANIGPGRRRRDEEFSIGFEAWTFGTGNYRAPGDAQEAIAGMLAAVEDVCADTTTLAVDGLMWSVCRPERMETLAFEKGWAVALTGRIDCRARLL